MWFQKTMDRRRTHFCTMNDEATKYFMYTSQAQFILQPDVG